MESRFPSPRTGPGMPAAMPLPIRPVSADMPRALPLAGLLAICLTVAGCAGTRPGGACPAGIGGPSTLPCDVRGAVERSGLCAHFAGEINGDGSRRDSQVFAAMTRLHCDRLDRDMQRLRGRYPGNRDVQKALEAAAQQLASACPVDTGNLQGTKQPC